jgi:MFS family permease
MRHPGFRVQFVTFVFAMMADNIEHVISYWVMFQKFHSPALAGFAIVSHWLPFLLFSVAAGALTDRFDPRRIIQCGMLLFILVSLGWGYLFITDTLQMWQAMLLLVVHGCAGVLWFTPVQVLLYDIVGPADLMSAVRLNATARYLGVLVGPAAGGFILLGLGPSYGIFLNTIFYLPLLLWLVNAPYGPRFRTGVPPPRRAVRGLADITHTVRAIRDHSVIVSMTILAGAASFFVGNAYSSQMPGFAEDLGHGDPGLSYSMLLAADACGAFLAGVLLESDGLIAAAAAHRHRARHTLVRFACRLFLVVELPARARPVVRRRVLRAVVQYHGDKPGADQRAAGKPRTRHRPVRHGELRPARLQRRVGRAPRRFDRRALVARGLGARHAGDGRALP